MMQRFFKNGNINAIDDLWVEYTQTKCGYYIVKLTEKKFKSSHSELEIFNDLLVIGYYAYLSYEKYRIQTKNDHHVTCLAIAINTLILFAFYYNVCCC